MAEPCDCYSSTVMKISYAYRIKLLLYSQKINFHKKSTTLISLIITKTLYNKNSSVKRYTYSKSHNTFNYTKWQKNKQYTKCMVKKVLIKKKKNLTIYNTFVHKLKEEKLFLRVCFELQSRGMPF